jgi:hypothetical protein
VEGGMINTYRFRRISGMEPARIKRF